MAGALDGIKVLDLCIILAGPTCGRTLAEYGADVIKMDPEHRPPALTPWLDVGRGKRSICLDISRPAGLDAFYRLVATADVMLEGFRQGVTKRLGIGYQQIRERKPDIIYVSINAFGQEGPWARRPGFDQNAQAATGIQVRNGGRTGKPAPPPFTFNDYGTGFMAAYGVMLALLERSRTGQGQRIEAALSYTASTFSSPFLIDYPGFERQEIEGPQARGYCALSRLYETADGWIYLAAADGEWDKLSHLEPFSELRSRPENDDALSNALAAIFKEKPTELWIGLLRSADIAVTPNVSLSEIMEDDFPRRKGLIQTREYGEWGAVDSGGVAARLSQTPPATGSSPIFGGDTDEVLLEVGYPRNEIEVLRRQGIIPPAEGLPLS